MRVYAAADPYMYMYMHSFIDGAFVYMVVLCFCVDGVGICMIDVLVLRTCPL